jgi:hypothetical protein
VWELIFMLVILKIPIVYLCAVVWWAIRAEPRPPEYASLPVRADPQQPCPWRRRPVGPTGSPDRPPGRDLVRLRRARIAAARAERMRR